MADPKFELFNAINKRDVPKVRELLGSGAIDVNKPFESEKTRMFREYFPLNYAVHEMIVRNYGENNAKSLQIIDLLLDAGADFNAVQHGDSPIILKILLDWHNPPEDAALVKNLLQRGLDPNAHNAIFQAVSRSNGINEKILLLLAFGANKNIVAKVNDYSPVTSTPLSVAQTKLNEYVEFFLPQQLRRARPGFNPPDDTEGLKDLVAVLRADPTDMETIKNVLVRMVRRNELSADNAIFIQQQFRITYNPARRHAVAAYAAPPVHPPPAPKPLPSLPPSPLANPHASVSNNAFHLAAPAGKAGECTGRMCTISRRGGRRHQRKRRSTRRRKSRRM